MFDNLPRLLSSLRPRELFFMVLLVAGIAFLLLAVIGQISWPPQRALDLTSRYVSGGIGALLILGSFLLFAKHSRVNVGDDPARSVAVLPNAGSPEVAARVLNLAADCKGENVTLIGTGLALLQPVNPLQRLLELVANGCIAKLELIFANPYSAAVRTRLVEEECADPAANIGLKGLESHIQAVLTHVKKSPHYPERISVRLFSNYPTFALLKVGSHYLVYSYSFADIGNQSPVIEFDRTCKDLCRFYDRHHKRVRSASVDAAAFFAARSGQGDMAQLDLHGFAVYFIPESDAFYHLGSEILGFDIRGNRRIAARYADLVGAAAKYGFHLTLADALYVADEAAVGCIEQIVENICANMVPIKLKYDVIGGFPDETSISLRCEDPTQQLLALHRDLVFQVYPQAIGSNYTLGVAKMNRCYCQDVERNEEMIRRYHAPYILDCFKPHFTLLDSVPPEQIEEKVQEMKTAFGRLVDGRQITMKSVAVMRKAPGERTWHMPTREILLSRRPNMEEHRDG